MTIVHKHILASRDIKVLGKSEALLNYRVEYIGEMSAFVQAGHTTISTQAGQRNDMKILHTADVHLREYGDLRWQALQQLTDIGKNKESVSN